MNFRADTVVHRSCTRDTAVKYGCTAVPPIVFVESALRSPSLLRSHTGGGGERGIRKNSIAIIVRCDIDSISLEDFRLDFIRTNEPTRTAFLPSGGAASPAMAALLSLSLFLFFFLERERGGYFSRRAREEEGCLVLSRKRRRVSKTRLNGVFFARVDLADGWRGSGG